MVLSLQTSGPMLLEALRSQDQYLAGSFLMFLALLTVIGMFISDLLLAALDPRIRLTGRRGEVSVPRTRALEHYVSPGAVRAAGDREADAGAGALLPRLAVADHVVEVPPPPHRGGLRA